MNDYDRTITLVGRTEELIDHKKLVGEREPWLNTLEYIRHGWNDECPSHRWYKRLSEMTVRDYLTHPWFVPAIVLASMVASVVGVLV